MCCQHPEKGNKAHWEETGLKISVVQEDGR